MPKRYTPARRSSDTNDPLSEVLYSAVPPFNMSVMFDSVSELRSGSLVMMFTTPPMALDPKRAEPPPRMTSTRSIMAVGSCSRP